MTQLTDHFSLEELTITQVRGVDNTPTPPTVENLKVLAQALEKVRVLLGFPILINSGYRSLEVNARVGGANGSAHCLGYAADFICPAFGDPLAICRTLSEDARVNANFDQMIEEGTWVHLSVDPRNRQQVLTKDSTSASGYRTGLPQAGV